MTHGKRRHIDGLTGVRGFGAIWVVLHHLREYPYHLDSGVFEPFLASAQLAVDMFFVLSGFIMAYVYQQSFAGRIRLSELISFLQFRVARMYPVHLLTFLWMLPVYWAGRYVFDILPQSSEAYSPASLVANVFMVHEWFPNTGAPNAPAWSVSAEWFAYLLFPFVALAFSFLQTKRLTAGRWPLIVALAMCILADVFYGSMLVRAASAFIFGMVMFEGRHLKDRAPAFASLLFFGLLLVAIYTGNRERLGVVIPILGGMLLALSNRNDYGARALSTKPLMYLGRISYSIYMVQWLIVTLIRKGIPAVFPTAPATTIYSIAGGLIAIILLAGIVHVYVEVPGRRFVRNLRPPTPAR